MGRAVLRRVLFVTAFFAGGGLLGAATHDLSDLAPKVHAIHQAALTWEQYQRAERLEDLPALTGPFEHYRAKEHLQFYQAASAFMRSQDPETGKRQKVTLLREASGLLSQIGQAPRELAFDLTRWRRDVAHAYVRACHAAGQHEELTAYLGQMPRAELDEELVAYYADSLRLQEQKVPLRRLVMAYRSKLASQLQREPLRSQEAFWRLELEESRRLVEGQRPSITMAPLEESLPADKGRPQAKDTSEPTMVGQLLALHRDLKEAYYADYSERFTKLLNYYAVSRDGLAAHKKPEKKVEAFLNQFDRHLADLPPALLQKYIKKMWDKQQLDLALVGSDVFLKSFKGHPSYPLVAYDKARLLEDSGKFARAYQELKKLSPLIMGSAQEESYLFRRAWLAYLNDQYPQANEHFAEYIKAYPDHKFTNISRYYRFQARKSMLRKSDQASLASLKKDVEAFVARYPLSFYSIKLIKEWQLPESMVLDKLAARPSTLQDYIAANPYFKMGIYEQSLFTLYQELDELELKEEAVKVLARLDQHMGYSAEAEWAAIVIAEAKKQQDANLLTVNALEVLQQHPKLQSLVSWQDLYPRFREKEITGLLNASQSTLPYEFVVSLIRQESAFNPRAVSSANAKGLMQIMPATASLVVKGLNRSSYDLFNPDDNLALGIHMLNRLHKKYNGRLDYVLAAYNAGDSVTDRWVAMRGGLRQDEFIESIPYGETREYIKMIFRNMQLYDLVYREQRVEAPAPQKGAEDPQKL